MARHLRVAAVQARSDNGAAQRNLEACTPLVAEAAARGAQLVLCPEFLAAGYIYEESIWDAGELQGGATESWLADRANEHGVTIGATYLEAEGEHFYNTFALFGPKGLVGRVRKRSLPFFEGWFFTPCQKSKILETEFGRIAVGICNDNQTAGFMRDVIEAQPDLILMPHSAPSPVFPVMNRLYRRIYDSQLSQAAKRYAKAFGVPVVMANKGSDEVVHSRVPLIPSLTIEWTFEGHSTIVDHRGEELAVQRRGQGVLVEDVVLDPAHKRAAAKPKGYWSFAPRLFWRSGGAMLRKLEKLGMQAYRDNPRRRAAALRCAARNEAHASAVAPTP